MMISGRQGQRWKWNFALALAVAAAKVHENLCSFARVIIIIHKLSKYNEEMSLHLTGPALLILVGYGLTTFTSNYYDDYDDVILTNKIT